MDYSVYFLFICLFVCLFVCLFLKAKNSLLLVTTKDTGRKLSKDCVPERLVQEAFMQCIRGQGTGSLQVQL